MPFPVPAAAARGAQCPGAPPLPPTIPEAIDRVTQIQLAAQLDQLDLAQTAKFDIQNGFTSNDREAGTVFERVDSLPTVC